MTALGACRWEDQFAEAWTEKRPAPLEMTDSEILDWVDEYCMPETPATPHTRRVVAISCAFISDTTAPTLREAVCLAAAKLEEAS